MGINNVNERKSSSAYEVYVASFMINKENIISAFLVYLVSVVCVW